MPRPLAWLSPVRPSDISMILLNLLPSEKRREVNLQHSNRLVLSIALISMSALLASLMLIGVRTLVAMRISAVISGPSNAEQAEVTPRVEEVNRMVAAVEEIQSRSFFPSGPLAALSRLTAQKVVIDKIGFEVSSGRINISGAAESREALISFRDALEASPEFSFVQVPAESLVRQAQLSFTLTAEVDVPTLGP